MPLTVKTLPWHETPLWDNRLFQANLLFWGNNNHVDNNNHRGDKLLKFILLLFRSTHILLSLHLLILAYPIWVVWKILFGDNRIWLTIHLKKLYQHSFPNHLTWEDHPYLVCRLNLHMVLLLSQCHISITNIHS